MSTYTSDLAPTSPAFVDGYRHLRAPFVPSIGGAAVTTYYYRLLDGTRSTSTDVGSIPAGAVVERVS